MAQPAGGREVRRAWGRHERLGEDMSDLPFLPLHTACLDEERAQVSGAVARRAVLRLEEAQHEEQQAVRGEPAEVGLVEGALGEELLEHERERLDVGPLGERARDEEVGGEAVVVGALERSCAALGCGHRPTWHRFQCFDELCVRGQYRRFCQGRT